MLANERTTLRLDGGSLYAKVKTPWFLYLFTLLAALGGFLFGYDTGVISGALILVRQEYKLSTTWQELIVASTIAAAALFALLGGYLNDKIGRKPVILLASVVFTSGSLCMAFAEDKFLLLVGRVIVGTGIGLSSTTTPMYIAESAPSNIRGRLVSINIVMVACGQFVANIISGLFSFTDGGWRYMLGLGALPAIAQFVAFLFMPESPRWLLSHSKHAEAKEVLHKLHGVTTTVDDEYESIRSSILAFQAEFKDMQDHSHTPLFLQIVRTPSVLRALIVGCSLQMIQQLAGINTVMYYSATIITMAGVRSVSAAIWLSALTSFVNFCFTFIGIYLVEKVGRRPLTLCSLIGAIISLGLLGAGFQLEEKYSPAVTVQEEPMSNCSLYLSCGECQRDVRCGFCYEEIGMKVENGSCLQTSPNDWVQSLTGRCASYDGSSDNSVLVWAYDFCPTNYYWLPMLGLVLYLVFFAPGMGPMPWTINAEIYPLWARGAANGAATFINWLFNLFVSISFLTLTEGIGAHGTFWMYLGFSLVGLLFLIFALPETKGKNLEEIEGIFATPWFGEQGIVQTFRKQEADFNYVHIQNYRKPCDSEATESRTNSALELNLSAIDKTEQSTDQEVTDSD